jgi:hypothetical protein
MLIMPSIKIVLLENRNRMTVSVGQWNTDEVDAADQYGSVYIRCICVRLRWVEWNTDQTDTTDATDQCQSVASVASVFDVPSHPNSDGKQAHYLDLRLHRKRTCPQYSCGLATLWIVEFHSGFGFCKRCANLCA